MLMSIDNYNSHSDILLLERDLRLISSLCISGKKRIMINDADVPSIQHVSGVRVCLPNLEHITMTWPYLASSFQAAPFN